MDQVRFLGEFSKLDADKHLAFGWAYVTEDYPDAQTLADIPPDEVRACIQALIDVVNPPPGRGLAFGA